MTQVTVTRPARRRPTFYPLPVVALDHLTDDSLAITFGVPPRLREQYSFQPGQHLTVRRVDPDTGEDARRSYSICSTPAELAEAGRLRIGVKQLAGGVFSGFAARDLQVGDEVEVMPPLGHFTTAFSGDRARHYVGIVAGSGITPVLSLVAAGLATEPGSRFTVLYGNRYARSVMFVDELADLKDRYPDRLQLVHVLSREPGDAELLSGRIDAERLHRLLDAFVPHGADEWFLCGPYGMVLDARAVLTERGVSESALHTELFHVPSQGDPAPAAVDEKAAEASTGDGQRTDVTIMLDGRSSRFSMGRGERVLDAALKVRAELPYACRGGVCSTCRAKVVEGKVQMAQNWALEPDELAAGYVLTCQSTPVTDTLIVDYDA